MDVGSWAEWTTLEVTAPKAAVWKQPGDAIRYTRNSALPVLPMQGTAVLDEVIADELVRMTLTTRGCRRCRSSAGSPTPALPPSRSP